MGTDLLRPFIKPVLDEQVHAWYGIVKCKCWEVLVDYWIKGCLVFREAPLQAAKQL